MNRFKATVSALFAMAACFVAIFLWLCRKAEPAERYLKANKEHQ